MTGSWIYREYDVDERVLTPAPSLSWTVGPLIQACVLSCGSTSAGNKSHPTYLHTPWCRVLLEKLTGLQLVKKFPAFYGTRRLITALTSVRHLSLSCASPIQSTYPHPTSWRSILILSTHLRLGLPSGLFPSVFPTKTLHAPLSSPIRATCPAHLILIDFITRKITPYKCSNLNPAVDYRKVQLKWETGFVP